MYSAPARRVPGIIWLLPVVIVVMVTSEFMVSPLLPRLAEVFDRPLGEVSLLITALALGQAVGGLTLGVALTRVRPALALGGTSLAFALAQFVPVLTTHWPAVLGTRFLAGMLMASMFTVALTAAGSMVPASAMARASGIVFSGVTFGLTLGSPLAGWLGAGLGWRWPFVVVSLAGVAAAVAVLVGFGRVPRPAAPAAQDLSARDVLRSRGLWATYLAGFLLTGSAAAAYSFYGALLARAGLSGTGVSVVLIGYGGASIVGNLLIARFAGERPARVLTAVSALAFATYLLTAWATGSTPALVVGVLVLGALGFTGNAAIMALVTQHVGNRAITNAIASTSVTLGIAAGSAVAGALVDTAGLRAPLYLAAAGVALAIGALRLAATTARSDQQYEGR